MILVDTNVLSEPMRSRVEPRVVAWLDRQRLETLFVSSVTIAEILFGIEALPRGKRRRALAEGFEATMARAFEGRVLAFDLEAARAYAQLRAEAQARGLAIAPLDGQIAAIAKVHDFAVATHDVSPFRAAGVKTIDPWTE